MNEKQANINVSVKNFFFKWMELTKPFHKLRPKEIQIVALILYHYYRLKQDVTNDKILWKLVFDYDTKVLIAEEAGISMSGLENMYSSLRKKNVIVDNKITKHYVPELHKKSKNFKIIFNFNIKYE